MSSTIEGLLLDVDGVLVSVWRPIPGAVDALGALHAAGLPFLLMTNTTTHTRAEIGSMLREAGFGPGVEPERIVTAPVATAAFLRSSYPGARCWLLGEAQVSREMEGVTFVDANGEAPEVVVVSGADPAFTWEQVSIALRFVMDGARLVGMHRNLRWITEDGLRIDAGGYLAALEAASGTRAEVAGKPAAAFFRSTVEMLGMPADRVAMVGDNLATDVLPAQAEGMTGVLVLTGTTSAREAEAAPPEARADHVLASLAELPRLLGLLV